MGMQNEIKTNLHGRISPSDWDSAGTVTRLSVTEADGTRYLLDNTGKGEELFEEIGRTIEANGRLEEDSYGDLVFVISDYTFC